MKTDHILFIASGAFHVSKPSDLLPELQGRLPIRVELSPLTVEDFKRILTETEASLIKQTVALMRTEGMELVFTDDSIDALAEVAVAGEQLGREYRRAPSANGARTGARRNLVHRSRPLGRNDDDRRRLCARRSGEPGEEHRFEPVYLVIPGYLLTSLRDRQIEAPDWNVLG